MVSRSFRYMLLLMLALVIVLPVTSALAIRCRADPKIKLSNGMNLDLGVYIDADPSQVTSVNFEFHVPVGVSLAKPEHTPGWSNVQETFTLIADQAPNQYYFVTTVYATVPNVTVTPYGNVRGSAKALYSGSGLANEEVIVSFTQ